MNIIAELVGIGLIVKECIKEISKGKGGDKYGM